MRAHRLLLALWLALFLPAWLVAAETERDLYLLGIGLDQQGVAGGWERVGLPGAWKGTRTGVVFKDQLYTTEANGCLYRTNLANGNWDQIGKAEFGDTQFLFGAADKLYSIETSGNLYRINPSDGTWEQVGKDAAWKSVRAGVVLKDALYTAEKDGALRMTNLGNGERKAIGKAEFATCAFLFAAEQLYLIDTEGSLFRVNPADGARTRLGDEKAWKTTRAGGIFHGHLYTAETGGGLFTTNLATGKREKVGQDEFGKTAFLVAAAKDVYTIETDGNLYRIFIRPKEGIDAYDWCPEEFEKAFREQGKAYYHDFHPRLVRGKEATQETIMAGLAWLREKAAKKDLVVIYIGCHGSVEPNEGWGFGSADGKMIWGHAIKAELAKLPCSVLIFIETCTSGGFADKHKNDPPLPPNVTALCACQPTQSTDNQLDLAALEGLYGRADFNHDGVVELDELIRYIELRYKEWWPEPAKMEGSQTPVLVKAKSMPGSMPLTKVSPQLGAVIHDGMLWSALVEKQDGDKFQVHLLGWSSKPGKPYFLTNHVTRDCICLPSEGQPLLVEQNGIWFPARLLSKEGEKYKVHYLGYNEEEMVTKERIKYPFVGRVEK